MPKPGLAGIPVKNGLRLEVWGLKWEVCFLEDLSIVVIGLVWTI